jgi:hypothetical protein
VHPTSPQAAIATGGNVRHRIGCDEWGDPHRPLKQHAIVLWPLRRCDCGGHAPNGRSSRTRGSVRVQDQETGTNAPKDTYFKTEAIVLSRGICDVRLHRRAIVNAHAAAGSTSRCINNRTTMYDDVTTPRRCHVTCVRTSFLCLVLFPNRTLACYRKARHGWCVTKSEACRIAESRGTAVTEKRGVACYRKARLGVLPK